jgi:ApaG protein
MSEHAIKITARSQFQGEQSSPESGRYVFSYTITIENAGREPARLLDRHWIVSDSNGGVQEVRGQGVVGEQPYLRPGERFEYTSGTIIPTPVGSMHGSYGMVRDDGQRFEAEIPPFSLASVTSVH